MPRLVKRMIGGSAKMMVAMMPGTMPTPNSMTTGTRYTKAGVVCMMSSTGRIVAAKRSLRAARMPAGMPTAAQNTTAVSTMASVVMVSGQTPSRSRKASEIAVNSATPRPAIHQASSAASSTNSTNGIASRMASVPFSTWSTGHCTARKTGRKFGTSQSLTTASIQSSSGSV